MNKFIILFLCFQVIIPFSFKGFFNKTKGIITTAIDFIPFVSNVIQIKEMVTEKDYITRHNITKIKRKSGSIPFDSYYKNAKKLFELLKFFKFCIRVIIKVFQIIIKGIIKPICFLIEHFRMKTDNTSVNTDI